MAMQSPRWRAQERRRLLERLGVDGHDDGADGHEYGAGPDRMALELTRRPQTRWSGGNLSRDVVPLRTMMDRLLESAFTPSFRSDGRTGGAFGGFGMDVYEDDNAYMIHCLLPGIDPNAVNVTVQGNVLTIGGESQRQVREGAQPLFQEIGYGRFQRQVSLGAPVDVDKAEADYKDGILTITLPKAEAAKPKSIKVHANGKTSR
jgi:HSP20 family protein